MVAFVNSSPTWWACGSARGFYGWFFNHKCSLEKKCPLKSGNSWGRLRKDKEGWKATKTWSSTLLYISCLSWSDNNPHQCWNIKKQINNIFCWQFPINVFQQFCGGHRPTHSCAESFSSHSCNESNLCVLSLRIRRVPHKQQNHCWKNNLSCFQANLGHIWSWTNQIYSRWVLRKASSKTSWFWLPWVWYHQTWLLDAKGRYFRLGIPLILPGPELSPQDVRAPREQNSWQHQPHRPQSLARRHWLLWILRKNAWKTRHTLW